jgi:hypothetical protein
MDRSATRNNFLDILLDPAAFAILTSLAVHATFGAYLLPIFTKSKPEPKAEPVAVKVVELTPSELQRIPQVPEPLAPTPTPQILPPANRSTATIPTTPSIATSPQTIPTSPVRTTPTPTTSKPPKGKKSQNPIPQTQPSPPNFNPDISFKPNPTPVKSPDPNNRPNSTKPNPQPKVTSTLKPKRTPSTPGLDDDGGERSPQPATTKPIQQPSLTPKPSGLPNPSPEPTGGNTSGTGLYGSYTQAAAVQLQKYEQKYPNLKKYPPQTLKRKYPPGIKCSKVKPSPFIVLMVVFGPTIETPDSDIVGSSGGTPNDIKVFKDETNTETTKLGNEVAIDAAVTEANTADINRPAADKGIPVLHQYRVEFDPASCKK